MLHVTVKMKNNTTPTQSNLETDLFNSLADHGNLQPNLHYHKVGNYMTTAVTYETDTNFIFVCCVTVVKLAKYCLHGKFFIH